MHDTTQMLNQAFSFYDSISVYRSWVRPLLSNSCCNRRGWSCTALVENTLESSHTRRSRSNCLSTRQAHRPSSSCARSFKLPESLVWWLIIGCVLFHVDVDQVSPHHNLLPGCFETSSTFQMWRLNMYAVWIWLHWVMRWKAKGKKRWLMSDDDVQEVYSDDKKEILLWSYAAKVSTFYRWPWRRQ